MEPIQHSKLFVVLNSFQNNRCLARCLRNDSGLWLQRFFAACRRWQQYHREFQELLPVVSSQLSSSRC
jgi:hypothetical protein